MHKQAFNEKKLIIKIINKNPNAKLIKKLKNI